jgi:hypothetical protein
MNDYIVVFFITAIVCSAAAIAITAGITSESWRVEAVGHGYAHFDKNSVWHWNDEAPAP